jgi:CHAT domain-containing protein
MSKRSPRILRPYQLLFICALIGCLWLGSATAITAQTPADQQVQAGVTLYQNGRFQEAIAQWQQALESYRATDNRVNQAIVLENLARVSQQLGQTEDALKYWTEATGLYQQLGNLQQLGRSLTEQAQAYSRLGQYSKAIAILCGEQPCQPNSALQIAQAAQDTTGEVAALGSLGDAYRLRGNEKLATPVLEKALAMTQALDLPNYRIAVLNSLGNLSMSQAQIRYRRAESATAAGDTIIAAEPQKEAEAFTRQALEYFTESIALAQQTGNQLGQVRALLSAIPALYRTQDPSAPTQVQQAIALVKALPPSTDKVYAILDLSALSPDPLSSNLDCAAPNANVIPLLENALETAKTLVDYRAESFVLGELGHIYECQGDLAKAMTLTESARTAADQKLRAKDSLYLWEWQTGRILKRQGKEQEAIAAYDRAVNTLEEIRSDLLNANREVQFDFRDTVDPLYRQLIALRLESGNTAPSQPASNLSLVLKTLDSLRIAELQNYFGDECAITPIPSDSANAIAADSAKLPEGTAVFNSIILNDRSAIVVRFPDGTEQVHAVTVNAEALRETINRYRITAEESSYKEFKPKDAQQLYEWIIAPFVSELEQRQIDTLVFIQDGILRSVPMAALMNPATQKYLIQDYAIAISPSLTLTDITPLERNNIKALTLGLTLESTVDNTIFNPLINVERETQQIIEALPGSQRLMDSEFTKEALAKALDRATYPIIHIATHGKFGSDAEDTFLITGDQKKLTITDLDRILRQTTDESIELLSLTACQTAIGDDRSALGLAGVAIQAGARSALASLWFINDETTAQISTQFYTELKARPISKAKALQAAQVALIEAGGETAKPGFWAPFILVGNWL